MALLPLFAFCMLTNLLAQKQVQPETVLLIQNLKEKEEMELDSLWKTIDQDDPQFKALDYDDSAWAPRGSAVTKLNENGVAWLRLSFRLTPDLLKMPLCLDIAQNGASEIYLDGVLLDSVGVIGAGEPALNVLSKRFPKSFSVADTGIHVIAVRYQSHPVVNTINDMDGSFRAGLLSSYKTFNINFRDANAYYAKGIAKNAQLTTILMSLGGIFCALAVVHLLLFCFYYKGWYNLYFGIYNLSIGLFCIFIFKIQNSYEIDLYLFYVKASVFTLILFSVSLTGFTNTLFGRSRIRRIIMLGIGALCFASALISPLIMVLLLPFYLITVLVESFYIIVRAMLRRERPAFIVGGGILACFAYIVILFLVSFLSKSNPINNFIDSNNRNALLIILITFPLSISGYLAYQFGRTNTSLQLQLAEVKRLSAKTLEQEHEKQHILQNQNVLLEEQVRTRTEDLQLEKQKSDELLLNILPQEIAEELKERGETQTRYHEEVTVIFTDFVNFTENSERWGAERMIAELHEDFTAFDQIMEKHGLEKIKTIGDAYLAVCGLPLKTNNHAHQTVLAALDILQYVREKAQRNEGNALDIRIGIHSGSLVAGIVGVKKFAYDIWGDTVNTAARLEQNSLPGKINISESTYQLVKDYYIFEDRGLVEAKGKGEIPMYFVKSTKEKYQA
ncbi:adenylate/guanylate cyclase domain-containing protein [Sphingobacterium chungjuense]|uniref:adenylate/guanylate cyclase domain-containing protein n=1 Tax=Sphingobacterium chungjuense TaxID=2675553 RepID=UPI0014072C17|nr:adenylate/guanylate cyclase domain-containing protein [Sphingobacterium chungjuense]